MNINEANIGSSILQNYERAEEILQTSLNSEGSALTENERYLESVQGHLDKLQAKWETFSVTFADDTGMKVIIDAAGALVDALNALTDTFGTLGVAGAATMGVLSKVGNIGKLNMPSYAEKATHRMLAA